MLLRQTHIRHFMVVVTTRDAPCRRAPLLDGRFNSSFCLANAQKTRPESCASPNRAFHQLPPWAATLNVSGHSIWTPMAVMQFIHRDQQVELVGQRLVILCGTGALKKAEQTNLRVLSSKLKRRGEEGSGRTAPLQSYQSLASQRVDGLLKEFRCMVLHRDRLHEFERGFSSQ